MKPSSLAEKVLQNELMRIRPPKAVDLGKIHKPNLGRNQKYPWSDLKVGDGFLVPCYETNRYRVLSSVSSCRASQQRRTGKRFATRVCIKGIKVWRVA